MMAAVAVGADVRGAETQVIPAGDGALLERELAAIRAEIAQLRAGDDDALDAERAASIRALVAEVLDDATGRASLQSSGLNAGYDGKAFLASPDGGFRLRIYGFEQIRWTINHRQSEPGADPAFTSWSKGFESRRTRFFFDGQVHDVTFRIRFTAGAGGSFTLDQAYTQWDLGETEYKLRVGQIYLPLFRDDFVSADGQLAVDSSVVNQVFNPGNSDAIQIHRTWDRVRFWLAYSEGLRSANTPWEDPNRADYAFTGRVELRGGGGEWDRFDTYTSYPGSDFGWMIGLAANYSYGATNDAGGVVDLTYVTADATIEGDGWNAAVMGVMAYDNIDLAEGAALDSGFLVQGGFFVASQLELFTRFDLLLASDDRPDATEPFPAISVGFTWYFAPNSQRLKFTANAVYFPDATTNTLVEAIGGNFAAQGLLPSGEGNQWAMQAQLQFQF